MFKYDPIKAVMLDQLDRTDSICHNKNKPLPKQDKSNHGDTISKQ